MQTVVALDHAVVGRVGVKAAVLLSIIQLLSVACKDNIDIATLEEMLPFYDKDELLRLFTKLLKCKCIDGEIRESSLVLRTEKVKKVQKTSSNVEGNAKIGSHVNSIIGQFEKVNKSYGKFYSIPSQRKSIERLLEIYSLEMLLEVTAVLSITNTMKYFPVVTSPRELEGKLPKLLASISKELQGNPIKTVQMKLASGEIVTETVSDETSSPFSRLSKFLT